MQGMPALEGHSCPLRRHGDEVERLPGGFYVAHGRCDDTMNLGGIKVLAMNPSSVCGFVVGFSGVGLCQVITLGWLVKISLGQTPLAISCWLYFKSVPHQMCFQRSACKLQD